MLVKRDKRDKPYVVCDRPCGLQMFVRRPEGIRRLVLLVERESGNSSHSLNRLLELYDFLSSRLREIRTIRKSKPDEGLEREEALLISQREKARKVLTHALREKRRELEEREKE